MQFVLRSKSASVQELLVDVAVHFVKTRGAAPKVFKIKRVTLSPRESISLATSFSLAVHTTRVPRPGKHAVEILINGKAHEAGSFEVIRKRA